MDRHTDRYIEAHRHRKIRRYTDTDRYIEAFIHTNTGIQIDRWTDIQTGKWTGLQIHRQIGRKTAL